MRPDKNINDTIRAFIAIELPDFVHARLRDIQTQIKGYNMKVTWTRPENIHLTLKFLGDVRPEMVSSIGGVIKDAVKGFSPITLCSQAVGFFPSVKRPRVLWTGLSGQTEELAQLQKKLDIGLSGIGFTVEGKKFTGHLTLGRIKGGGNPDMFIDIMKKFQDMTTDSFVADSVKLFRSKLLPAGPVYSVLLNIPLTSQN